VSPVPDLAGAFFGSAWLTELRNEKIHRPIAKWESERMIDASLHSFLKWTNYEILLRKAFVSFFPA
jgi:hypothetical protein